MRVWYLFNCRAAKNQTSLCSLAVSHEPSMRGYIKFCQRGQTLHTLFLVGEGRKDPNTIISGPSSARQRKRHLTKRHLGVSLACRGWANIERWLLALGFSGDPDQLLRNPIAL